MTIHKKNSVISFRPIQSAFLGLMITGMSVVSLGLSGCDSGNDAITSSESERVDESNVPNVSLTSETENETSKISGDGEKIGLNGGLTDVSQYSPQMQQVNDYIAELSLTEQQKGVLYLYADALNTIAVLNLQNEDKVKQSGQDVFIFAGCVVDKFPEYTNVMGYTQKIESIILNTDSKRLNFETFNNLLAGDFGEQIQVPETLNCDELIQAHIRD